MGFFSKLFPSENDRNVKKLKKIADKIQLLEESYKKLSDDELQGKTAILKDRLGKGETLDDILVDAFAAVREASARVLKMRHFYVQLLGGICLHQGRIAEMKTGEGKTLVATLPAYLNALEGKGMQIVTVNDYLARRDAEWMGKIFRYLGLTVGVVVPGMSPEEKKKAYACDIAYCTNNELGFDYLRDNMVIKKEDKVQRDPVFAIIDEVDSILIDEARTPLIISGRGNKSSELYTIAHRFARTLVKDRPLESGGDFARMIGEKIEVSVDIGKKAEKRTGILKEYNDDTLTLDIDDATLTVDRQVSGPTAPGDVIIEEKEKTVRLTESGIRKAERFFKVENLADGENTELNHHINNAMKAQFMMKLDVDYIVDEGEIIIVDEFTGRKMIGRRYSEGLHQAIEAKENVAIRNESKTLATITFQNFFRLYKKLSGMTGTAKTEEAEFRGIYNLDVVVLPTNLPMKRADEHDQLFTKQRGKIKAIIDDIADKHEKGQPVLVGTVSVEKSEELSRILKQKHIPHNVLNAKNHQMEAEIIAQAGRPKQVTIATNMAGRGTDIMLGGNPEYLAKQKMEKDGFKHELVTQATSYAKITDEEVLRARTEYERLYKLFSEETDKEKQKVVELGGLRVIGTERHESRRIDNQLRGRSGRQGDPGSTVFYISLEDDVARIFGGERLQAMTTALKVEEDTPIVSGMITKQIERAQKMVEDRNYSTRKHVLNYDDVMNKQRETIYGERNKVLSGESVHEQITKMIPELAFNIVNFYADYEKKIEEWDFAAFNFELERLLLPTGTNLVDAQLAASYDVYKLRDAVADKAFEVYERKIAEAKEFGADFEDVERIILLKYVDMKWMDHIDAMDHLRKGIGLRAYGQNDPVIAYRKEGFDMFDAMVDSIRTNTVTAVMKINIQRPVQQEEAVRGEAMLAGSEGKRIKVNPMVRQAAKTGPNDPCPCGSGKKYKNCCGS